MTLVIQISNTDNKLSQSEWAGFVAAIRQTLRRHTQKIHFEGGSPWDAAHQQACWVTESPQRPSLELIEELKEIRQNYRQDSVAVTLGETDFI